MREQIEAMNVPHFFSKVADHVTLSFGVVSMVPGKGQSVSHLIQLADDLLYSAKQSGRDQVRSWRQAARAKRASAV
jgi:diguanylate cyclase (GGDEF)-like protein